jgi:flagellar FliL protein
MAEATGAEAETGMPGRGGAGKGLLIGLVLALLLGAGGFYATWSGLLALPSAGGGSRAELPPAPGGEAGFVPLETLTVTIGPESGGRLLRISATVETEPGAEARLQRLMPRVLDVLATYLHALREEDLRKPAVMTRLRAHLLRRVRVVAGEDVVRDLLITEFVLQ